MQVSTLILMTWDGAQSKHLWACRSNFVRRAMFIVQNAIQTVQLRIVEGGWEVEADEATCRDRLALQRGLIHQREGRGVSGRGFAQLC